MADQSPTATAQPITPGATAEALKYLLYAQQFSPSHYGAFLKELEIHRVPFSYKNPQFLEFLVSFSERFKAFLAETKIPEEHVEAAVPKDLVDSLVVELDSLPATLAREKRKRAAQIAKTYVQELKNSVRLRGDQALETSISNALSAAAQRTQDPRELPAIFEQVLTQETLAITTSKEEVETVARPIAQGIVKDAKNSIAALATPLFSEEVLTKSLVEAPLERKDLWLKTYSTLAALEPQPSPAKITRLARAAEAFLSTATGDNLTSPTVFFQTGAKGLQKPLAVLADAALTVFPRGTREKIVESVLKRGWETTTKLDELNKRFGSLVVSSELFQNALTRGGEVFRGGKPSAIEGAVGGIRNVVSDVATSVFGSPSHSIEHYFILVELGIIKPRDVGTVQQFYVAGAHSHRSGLFSLLRGAGGEAARWGIGKIAKKAAGKLAGTALGKFFGAIAGSLGGPVGAFLGGIFGEKVLNFFGRLGRGIFGLFAGRTGTGKRDPLALDSLNIVLLVVGLLLVPILLLSLFVSGINTPAMFNYGLQAVGGVPGIAVDCQKQPGVPQCRYEPCPNCLWPTSGYITQGPRVNCSAVDASHEGVNAIDIAAPYGSPVYTVTSGTVVGLNMSCSDTIIGPSTTPGCGGGYGNYVDIRTPEGYVLRYAHLSYGSIVVSLGDTVTQGDQIGKVDNNGNSTGNHLHFEVLSGPNIFSFLPTDFVSQYQSQVEGCVNEPGCKTCPAVYVGN